MVILLTSALGGLIVTLLSLFVNGYLLFVIPRAIDLLEQPIHPR